MISSEMCTMTLGVVGSHSNLFGKKRGTQK